MASSPQSGSSSGSSPPSPPATSPPSDSKTASPPTSNSSPPSPPSSSGDDKSSPEPTASSPPSPPASPPPSQSPPAPPTSSAPPPTSNPPSSQNATPPPSSSSSSSSSGGGSTSPPANGGSPPSPPQPSPGGGPTTAVPPPSGGSTPSQPAPQTGNGPPTPSTSSPVPLTPPSSNGNTPSSGGALAPPAHKASPTHSGGHSGSSSSSSSSSSPSSSPSSSMLIGVGAGAAVIAMVMVVACVVCAFKKKKKRVHEPMQYYADHSLAGGGKGGGDYYSGQPNWHNQNHVMKVPPAPGMGTPGGSWGTPQGPTSGEMSGMYSGGPRGPPLPPPSPGLSLGFNKSTFTYDELEAATGGFSQANLLGQGGFGYVHKGILPNGKEVAVKSLKSGSGQGEREFQAEVEIISRVHHRHLVSLVGYCIAESRRMLVYEFVPNGTMEYHLYGKGRPTMDWPTRLRIALGSAKGLAYLHEDCHPRIIHRDIKAANILLDNNYEAMVADFGLAKLSSDNYTHVSTRVMGTFGYLAPEYASSGKLTEKSDVFSFGVMLLELITGRKPVDVTNTYMEDSLVDWARPILTRALEDGNFDELVDPNLEGNYNPHELSCMAACAAATVRHSAKRRPKMSQVVRALEGDATLDDLSEGVRPGQSSAYGSSGSSEYDTSLYNADMQKFRKVVMSSQDYGSSEYGATSEYGLNPSSSSGESHDMSWKHKQGLNAPRSNAL